MESMTIDGSAFGMAIGDKNELLFVQGDQLTQDQLQRQ